MGHNIETVTIAAGGDATSTADQAVRVVPAGPFTETISVATTTTSASGTDTSILSAQGTGVTTVLVGLVVTTDTGTSILLHWGTGTSNPVLQFNYLEPGGVAYNFAPWVLKSQSTNQALYVDVGATANVTYTLYYYTE